MLEERNTGNKNENVNKNHAFLLVKKEYHPEKAKIIAEIIRLRQKLGLSIDQHWHEFIQKITLKEVKEVLSGLKELALIAGILTGIEIT